MRASHGVGLAAPQIGESLQLTVLDISQVEDRPSTMKLNGKDIDPEETMPLVLVNPQLDLGGETEILSIGVLPERRRRGIAGTLLNAVFAEAERRGGDSVVLEVAADNDPARRLYAGLGFRPVGRRPRYYNRATGAADALILRCVITAEPDPAGT